MSKYFPTSDELSRHVIFPGVTIGTFAAEKMMLSFVEIQPGAEVPEHSHPHEQIGMVIKGKAIFHIGDERKTMVAGDLYRIPGGVTHSVLALDELVQALDIFNPIREEYR